MSNPDYTNNWKHFVILVYKLFFFQFQNLRKSYFPFNGRSLVASPSMVHRRPRKVMSKTFQSILNKGVDPTSQQQNFIATKSTQSIISDMITPTPLTLRNSNTGLVRKRNNFLGKMNRIPAINNQVQNPNRPPKSDQEIRRQLINIINNMSPQQLSINAQGLLNSAQQLNNIIGQKNEQIVNVNVVRKKSIHVPFPSLINRNVNAFANRKPVIRKTPIITMIPKSKMATKIRKPLIERKKLTMIEKMRTIPPLSAMKPGVGKTVQNAVSNFQKGSIATIDSNRKIQVVKSANNTAEVKIVNQGTGLTGKHDPNFIVLKDITITNKTDGTNGTKMSVTLMSQATGGRPIVIEANSNIVLSQEKMANGTVQFVVKTDTNGTTFGTTTPASTVGPTEEQEIEAEETTTAAAPTTTGEV